MRDYGRVAPTFWTRGSGKKLRGNPQAQIVALYLFTCPASTMIGIYHLAIPTMAHETGLTPAEAERALADVVALDVARYDSEEELVYLPEGARYQIGDRLKASDKRVTGIKAALAQFARHPFAQDFVRRYAVEFSLSDGLPDDAAAPPSSPLAPPEGACKALRDPVAPISEPLASQARQGKDQATQEISPPPAGARAHEDRTSSPTFAPPETPPSPLGVAIADAEVLLAAVARHPLLATLHNDRRWAQHASGGFMTSATRAGDVEAAVDAFVTGEAAKAPAHPEALAAWVRDNIGRYLKKAKQHGDDARARQRRDAERGRPSRTHSPDAQEVIGIFGPMWASKKRKAFVPGTGDERHAEAIAERARAAATGGDDWRDVVRHWCKQHLVNADRLVVESEHALRTMGAHLTAYGLPKKQAPATEKPMGTVLPFTPAPPPPDLLAIVGRSSGQGAIIPRRPGGTS